VLTPTVSPTAERRHLRAAERALSAGEQRLREIIEGAPVAFIATDAEGLILDWNTEAELVFGWPRGEALGRDFGNTVLPQAVRGAYRRELAELLQGYASSGTSRTVEVTAVHKDGADVPVEMTIARAHAGDSNLIRVYAHDLTAQKQADADRRLAEERLVYQSLHDPLTGLANQTLLLDRIGHALALVRRGGTTTAVLHGDIDNFKLVNESLGHHGGDALLIQVARRLRELLRATDTVARTNGDTLSRIGGDDFVIVCESLASEQDAIRIAERVMAAFSQPFEIANERVFVRLSIGIALRTPRATPASLMRDADVAMHRAKERGGARYEVLETDDSIGANPRARALNGLRRENDLRDAVEREQLRLFYQPIVSVLDGGIVGAEALLRWDHPNEALSPRLSSCRWPRRPV
jgi:diguanylate cyclase (GGDEF)-like protein/PAS domain S-box-containing protein